MFFPPYLDGLDRRSLNPGYVFVVVVGGWEWFALYSQQECM